METTKKSARKTGSKASEDKIKAAYVTSVLTNGKRPASVFKFCLDLGIKEDDFYNHFGSFDALERQIWNSFIQKTTTRLTADKSFGTFTVREKILAFYYTLIEELRSNRSYILVSLDSFHQLEIVPGFLKTFKASFETFFETILGEGKTSGEIANRPFIDKRYPQLFWLHMAFIINFWKNDDSPAFEKTDAAIEKSVNLAFDLIGKGAVDSAIDFAKFIYQTKR